jgi:repressor of nif and glnA expression
MDEKVYVVCREHDEKTKFIVQRLKRFHSNIEIVTAKTLWKLDTLSGVYISIIDPDEMEPELLDEVVSRVNNTYDPARSLVSMITAEYGVA